MIEYSEAATQLRLVNGLLIIEDSHPLEVSSSSRGGQNFSSGSIRAALREGRNHDLHGHGYLNRAASLRSSSTNSRRLLKDGQIASTVTTTTTTPPRDNSIDDGAVLVLDIVEGEGCLNDP